MSYREMACRLTELEAAAARQGAVAHLEAQEDAAAEAQWIAQCNRWAEELADVPVTALLNKSVTELLIWAELHRPGSVERMLALIPDDPLEHLWSVGGREWYFDLCRLLGAPYQRRYWMDARLPRPPHIYWPDDPQYLAKEARYGTT